MIYLFKRILTSLGLLIIIFLSVSNTIILTSLLLIIAYFSLDEFNSILSYIFKRNSFYYFISIFISLIYLTIFIISIWFYLHPLNLNSTISIFFLLLICISTDIGGFVVGKLLGGKKLTKISPNKTYSGAIGSIILSLVAGSIYFKNFEEYINFEFHFLAIILIITLISQLGDLFISLLKRKAKIKDTGSILPGHGGILDRIDGILLALPIGIILISI